MSTPEDRTPPDDVQVRERVMRLFNYLRELAALRLRTVRTIEQYESVLWFGDIPHETSCFCIAWNPTNEDDQSEYWIDIRNPHLKPAPRPSKDLQPWIDALELEDSSKDAPSLRDRIPIVVYDEMEHAEKTEIATLQDFPEIQKEWEKYVQEKWKPWAEIHRQLKQVLKVYTDLFAIYQKQQRLGEAFEVVVGLGFLTWKPEGGGEIRRHLIVAQTNLTFDAARGIIRLGPAGEGAKPVLEQDMLEPAERPDAIEHEAISQQIAEIGDSLWDGVKIPTALKSWVNAVSARGIYGDEIAPQNSTGSTPVIHLAPAVILRKRTERSFIRIFQEIIEHIKDGNRIPIGVERLVKIVDDLEYKTVQDGSYSEGGKKEPNAEAMELFFPLEINEEQLQIVRRLGDRQGILVQGPPGTGKSHTIANLICHLLAHGRRVLVTSHTARALKVLKEKIPKEIGELCVILLGDDLSAMESMETSVRAITNKYTNWDAQKNQQLLDRLRTNIDSTCKLEASTLAELREIREKETYKHSSRFDNYTGTAQSIAMRVQEEKDRYSWILEEPNENVPPPLTDAEASELLKLMRESDQSRREEIIKILPPIESLLTPESFRDLVSKEKITLDRFEKTAAHRKHPAYSALLTAGKDKRKALKTGFIDLLNCIRRLRNHPEAWVGKAIDLVLAGQDETWRELLGLTSKHLDAINESAPQISEFKVSGLEGRDKDLVRADACKLLEHLDAGGKLRFPRFRSKSVRQSSYLFKHVRINGTPCDNTTSIKHFITWLDVSARLDALHDHWSQHIEPPSGPFDNQVARYRDLCKPLEELIQVHERLLALQELLKIIRGIPEPSWHKREEIITFVHVINAAAIEDYLNSIRAAFDQLVQKLSTIVTKSNSHPVAQQALNAVKSRNEEAYESCYKAIKDLQKSKVAYDRKMTLFLRLSEAAPSLAKVLSETFKDSAWDDRVNSFTRAWNWARANSWLKRMDDPKIYDRKSLELDACRVRLRTFIGQIAEAKAWRHCLSRLKEEQRQHLMAWAKAVQRIGKGTGKYAPMHRREARKHMEKCRPAIPAWIMPIYRVAESLRPGEQFFDVAIVDEASQSGPEALFLTYLAEQIVVVGDDKQISPEFIGVNREDVDLLRQRYLFDIPHSDAVGVDTSFFEFAEIRYGGRIRLREHFRCMPEIIQFSNNLCYRYEPLIPLRQYGTERLSPVVVTRYIKEGYQKGRSPRIVNPPEAVAVSEQIALCCADPFYNGKTMGVISLLGSDQAKLIETYLLTKVGPEEMERRHLVCGDAYAFQGDERDVIFLSLVSAPTEGQRIGTLASKKDERRFNVAASRAKDQMWLFHSATLNDLSPNCLRYQLLEYCQNPKVEPLSCDGIEISKLKDLAKLSDRSKVLPPHPFDSWFELDVFLRIHDRGYRVIPQFEVAGYFIDLVVEGMKGRLAVECDGDNWHGRERYEQDQSRQRQLERCGWTFWRVRGSSFHRDPDGALQGLWELLARMGIHPQSSQKSGTGAGWTSEEDQTQGEQKSQEKEDPDTNKSKTDREGAPRHGMHSEEKRKEEEQIEKGNKKVTENHIISESKIPGQPPKAENTIAEKTVHKAEGTLPKMNLADFIDPLPNTLFHLLPEKEWNCEACGKLRNILVGPFGPYLKCTGRKCGKNKGIDLKMIREAFRLLQIPCPACGSPMIVDRGIRGGPFPGCSQYPNCMANESWNDLNQRLKTVEVRQRLGNMKAT